MSGLIVAGLELPPSVSLAQESRSSAPAACRAIATAIDDDLKAIALDTVAVAQEDSAPRAQVHASTLAAAQVRIQTNVQLMALNRCDPIAGPIDSSAYRTAAETCWAMKVRTRRYGFGGPTAAEAAASCYLPDWRRATPTSPVR